MITAAHCVYKIKKENILILANSLTNKIGKKNRFGQTTHHVDKIRLHEDFVMGQPNSTKFDIGLLQVKEPFTGTVNFARLPPVLLNVEGKNAYNPTCYIRIRLNILFFRWQGVFDVWMGY